MTVDVLVEGGRVPIDRSAFADLLGNSVVNARVPYRKALESGEISVRPH